MTFFKQTIRSVPLEGQTVLVRADYNVPLRPDDTIDDDFRIRASLPTIKQLLDEKCKVVIISHLGRPRGRDLKLSLEPVAQRLANHLGQNVRFVSEAVGDKVKMAVKKTQPGQVIMLENLRFYPGEEANDPQFAKQLAGDTGARYFVQDGFGVVHRAHASTAAITLELPSVAGLLLEKEYTTITKVMSHPDQPLVAVLGGAKVSDKISVIRAFIKIASTIVITGVMANTFLKYKGIEIGKSKFEPNEEELIKIIYQEAADKVGKDKVDDFIWLPFDAAVGKEVSAQEPRRLAAMNALATDDLVLDMGDESIDTLTKLITKAKTVVWSGTVGIAELPNFAHGSARLALALATHPDTTSIIGGGDTADFVLKWDARHGASFSHVSTGGSASLELMAGQKLPGIESLLDA